MKFLKNVQFKNIQFRGFLDFAFYSAALTVFCLITISVLKDDIRENLHDMFIFHQREVLSTATGNIFSDGQKVKVIKVRKNDEFFLEIYGHGMGFPSTPLLLSRIPLSFKKDAYINFRGISSNLALYDIDGDNRLEIVVPGYERDLSTRVNVYKYDEEQNIFKLANMNLFDDNLINSIFIGS